MANPLPNEAQLYETIRKEGIRVPLDVWDLIYHRIGDCLTAISLMCDYYLSLGQPMPISEAGKIPGYIDTIKAVISRITRKSSPEAKRFPEFQGDPDLHPIIANMFMHYIPNDAYIISLIVEDTIDPIDPNPIPEECLRKILGYCHSSCEFMDRLRKATAEH